MWKVKQLRGGENDWRRSGERELQFIISTHELLYCTSTYEFEGRMKSEVVSCEL